MPPKKQRIKKEYADLHLDIYLVRIMKHVHPGCSLSTDAKIFLNQLIVNFINRMCLFVANIMQHGRTITLSARDVQTATRLFLKDTLVSHAVSEGTKAVTKYVSFIKKGKKKVSQAEVDALAAEVTHGMARKRRSLNAQ